ncbi:hypothetical protein [Azospirillum melinis]
MRREIEGRGWVIARRPPPPRPGKTVGRVAPGGTAPAVGPGSGR